MLKKGDYVWFETVTDPMIGIIIEEFGLVFEVMPIITNKKLPTSYHRYVFELSIASQEEVLLKLLENVNQP